MNCEYSSRSVSFRCLNAARFETMKAISLDKKENMIMKTCRIHTAVLFEEFHTTEDPKVMIAFRMLERP